ncbi:MAG: YggS family pyridoxal phosphate-dependent enzyme, partial [Lachnospiraceae bacterium]
MVKQNLEQVEKNILAACRKSGRSRDEVTLIAVSKTKPVSMLQEA